jgi:hypothetical protein
MQLTDWLSMASSAAFGMLTGWLLGGTSAALIGAGIGVVFAYGAAKARVRPAIAATVFVGSAAGVLIGASIVETICLPDSCTGLEITGGVVIGFASMIGVGLVAALVTRSFDEYNESVAQGKEPPTVGCETGD